MSINYTTRLYKMSVVEVENSQHILARLMKLYSDPELSDLQLKVGNRQFSTHKLVLCMSSDVFKTMLTSETWPEAHSKRVVLQEEPECVDVFEDFLKYLYNGRIVLQSSTVLPLLTLADKYNIPDLSATCLDYMCDHCLPSSGGHVVSWLQYSIVCGHRALETICRDYITYNFQTVMRSREFTMINTDILLSFLKLSDLVVEGEHSLYVCLKTWLNNHRNTENGNSCSDTEFRDLFHKVMCHIRFPMMQLNKLASLDTDCFVQEFKDFYLEKLFTAMKFHTTYTPSQRRQLIISASNRDHFCPRSYTTETWSTVMTVENVSKMAPGDVQGAFFTTPASYSEVDQHELWDWHIHLYPKGVVFNPCTMISVPNNLALEGDMFRTVRLAVTTNCERRRHVDICVLVMGSQNGKGEYVHHCVMKTAIFDQNSPLFNINDIVPYEALVLSELSPCLVAQDTFKIVIIIKPVSR